MKRQVGKLHLVPRWDWAIAWFPPWLVADESGGLLFQSFLLSLHDPGRDQNFNRGHPVQDRVRGLGTFWLNGKKTWWVAQSLNATLRDFSSRCDHYQCLNDLLPKWSDPFAFFVDVGLFTVEGDFGDAVAEAAVDAAVSTRNDGLARTIDESPAFFAKFDAGEPL